MPRPAFLYLDVAGTLFHKPDLVPAFQSALGRVGVQVADGEFLEMHKRLSEAIQFPSVTTAGFYRWFNAEVVRALGGTPTEELLLALERACAGLPWRTYDDIDALKDVDVPLGIISNWDTHLRQRLAAVLPLTFEQVVVSSEFGVDKPDVRLYRQALERLDVTPDRVAYVGDSPRLDVEPALRVGMRAVLLDRLGVFPEHPGERVRDLREFAALVLREA